MMLKNLPLAQQTVMMMLNSAARQLCFLHHRLTHFILLSSPTARQIQQQDKIKLNSKSIHNIHQTASKILPHQVNPLHLHAQPRCVRWCSESVKSSRDTDRRLYSLSANDLLSQAHIKSLSVKLSCSVAEIKSFVKDYAFLIHMDLDLLESKVNLLLSYDLPVSFVKNHLRIVYQASEKVLDERLKLLKDSGLLHSGHLGIDKLAHLLECNGSEFPKSFKQRCDQRDALEGCPDQLSYLQMRLGCSEEKARSMLNSYPLERRMSNVKLKAVLDFFLIEVERSPDFFITYRKLLTFSVNRLRHRWLVMQRAGLESEAQMVYVWCMSQREFEKQYSEHLTSSSLVGSPEHTL